MDANKSSSRFLIGFFFAIADEEVGTPKDEICITEGVSADVDAEGPLPLLPVEVVATSGALEKTGEDLIDECDGPFDDMANAMVRSSSSFLCDIST